MEGIISTQQGRAPMKSIAFIDQNQEFRVVEAEGIDSPYSAILLPNKRSLIVDPLHVDSMFTRLFFFEGHGLEHYKLFSDTTQVTGGRIQVWKIDWNGDSTNTLFEEPTNTVALT